MSQTPTSPPNESQPESLELQQNTFTTIKLLLSTILQKKVSVGDVLSYTIKIIGCLLILSLIFPLQLIWLIFIIIIVFLLFLYITGYLVGINFMPQTTNKLFDPLKVQKILEHIQKHNEC